MNKLLVQKGIALSLLALILNAPILLAQEDRSWTHFRGTGLNGISREKGFPTTWSDTLNIAWKFPQWGKGWSSPVVLDKQVWFTSADRNTREMRAICVDLESGKKLQDRLLFQPEKFYRIHAVNSYATPSPAIEKERLYVHFGRYGTACLDTQNGEILWKRSDLQCEHIQGPGSSLMIYRDKLIVHLEGTDVQHILALDKTTGETLWTAERPAELYEHMAPIGKKAFTTPIIIRSRGRDLLISNGSRVCNAFDPDTGKEVWRIIQGDDSTIAMPVEGAGLVYFYTSFVTGEDGRKYAELFAVDPNGTGDIGHTHVRWRMKAPILQLSTPVFVDGLLYTVDSEGAFFCLEASSGEILWTQKLKGKFNSSPIYADGLLYISNTKGQTLVYRSGPEPELVASNELEGEIWATPALTGGSILIRTSKFLYKIAGH
jgi:outer membrane protein assembly factor BamB